MRSPFFSDTIRMKALRNIGIVWIVSALFDQSQGQWIGKWSRFVSGLVTPETPNSDIFIC